jgi:hypothetical protein
MTLVKNSMIYSFTQGRFLIPIEHFIVNGLPLLTGDLVDDDAKAISDDFFLQLSPSRAKAVAGNMMNLQAVGIVICAALNGLRLKQS